MRRALLPGLVLTGALLAPGARADVVDRIMAVVNGRLILLSDVRGFQQWGLLEDVKAGDASGAVTRLVERELVLAEVERYALPDPDPASVDAGVRAVRGNLPPDEFRDALAAIGWTEGHLRRVLRNNLRMERYLEERFTAAAAPTEAEAMEYYRTHEAEFARDGRTLPFQAVRETVRDRLADIRRRELIESWIAGLRRRADITRLDQ